MEINININKPFTPVHKLKYKGMNLDSDGKRSIFMFNQNLHNGEELVKTMEEVRVLVQNVGVTIAKGKPANEARGARQAEQPETFKYDVSGEYDKVTAMTATEQAQYIFETYVLPLYTEV
jgi:hypothetical protein